MRRALLAVVALVAALATLALASSAGAQASQPSIAAASWYLVGDDGAVLARHDAARSRAIASITKLMTAVVVLEHADLDDVVSVSPQAAGIGESTVYLRAGEELTVSELLRATLIPSANDAAEALALHVGAGSVDRFVELMNEKADELGLTDTHFENPHGLDEAGHVSSARDATALVRFALGIPFIRDALSRETLTLPGGRTFETTDDLLASWPPLVAGKTGHTQARRLVADGGRAARRRRRSTEPCSAATRAARGTRRCSSSSRTGSTSTERSQVIDARARLRDGGDRDTASRTSSSSSRAASRAPIRVGRPLVERVVAPTSLALPVAKGQRLGRVEVYDGNRLVAVVDPRRRARPSPTPASGRRRSGTRRRRRGTSGSWSRDRHRDRRTPRSTAR